MKSADCSDSSGALAPERITLAAGESITVPIEAANPNRATGIHFEAGVPGFYWNNSGVVRLTVTRTE